MDKKLYTSFNDPREDVDPRMNAMGEKGFRKLLTTCFFAISCETWFDVNLHNDLFNL